METYFIDRLRETYRLRRERIAALSTRADAEAYVRHVRRCLGRAFGPFPDRTPLKVRTARTTVHEGFRIEHVRYESRPGYHVTANLYLPAGMESETGRRPAVLFTCGHSAVGKAYPAYAKACMRLARTGYVVLIYDPINQGERDIFASLDRTGRPTRESPCIGHNYIGKQLGAAGEWLGAWRVWDGMRGLDYLCARPEVDVARVGVMGQSGGGTLSAYLWANDRRLSMVASSCWATSYLNDIENGMSADDEQYPPGWMADGLDKIDFFISRAGEPALLLGTDYDFFDNRGLESGYAELRKLHRLMGGKAGLCRLSFATGQHGLNDTAQTAALDFFNAVSGNRRPPAAVPAVVPAEPELLVTPTGDVHRHGATPVYQMLAARARKVARSRKPVGKERLAHEVRRALRMTWPCPVPPHRRMFQTAFMRSEPKQRVFRFLVETEPGILCPLYQVQTEDYNYHRLRPRAETHLYVPHVSSREDLERPLVMAGHDTFFTLDLRGLGEGLHAAMDAYGPYGHEYMRAGHATMYGETLLGMRLYDLLAAVRLLKAEGASSIHLHGRGFGAVPAMLAAIFDKDIASVRTTEGLESFLALATEPLTDWPAFLFPRGVLKHFDLPDVRRTLGGRLSEGPFADRSRCPR